jgi:hypothetical protein
MDDTSKPGRRFYPPTESDIPMHGWRPYHDVHRERIRAHDKHDSAKRSMERAHYSNPRWLPVLTEELGEVARVICDGTRDADDVLDIDTEHLRAELVQLAAMACAWIDAIDLSRPLEAPGEVPGLHGPDVPQLHGRA